MLSRRRFLKKFFWSFLSVVGFASWFSFHVIRFNSVRSSHSPSTSAVNVSHFPPELERQQDPTIVTPKTSPSPIIFSTSESKRESIKHRTNLITTTTCAQHYFLLILVSSAPSNFQRRRDIRQTWGFDTALKPRWKTVFLVAQTQNQNESNSLLKECETFGDLIRADYLDHYWNQTLKIQMGFEWAARYCKFSFLLKMDDDVFLNTKTLLSLLNTPTTPREKLYMGRVHKNPLVERRGKWKISKEEFNGTHYPSFCPGFGIVLSPDVVDMFVDLFDVLPKFRLDDVYIGMLANKTGVTPIHNPNFEVWPTPKTKCRWKNSTLARHAVTGDCLYKVFNEMHSQ